MYINYYNLNKIKKYSLKNIKYKIKNSKNDIFQSYFEYKKSIKS